MFLDAFKIRLGLMGVGAIALAFYLLAGGRFGPGDHGTIQIEYGIDPDRFEGMQVAIDGRPAGELKSFGAATRTAFAVDEGRHEIRVVSEDFACRSRTVNIESGRTVMLVLDFGGSASSDGSTLSELVLQ